MADQSHNEYQAADGRGRTARRGLCACLVAVLALAFGLIAAPAARAGEPEPIKADITVDTSAGYARLLFHFSEEIDADVHMANNVLVITFKSKVSTSVDRLPLDARDYISAARRDPDGMAVRMAIARRVRLNSMMAAERLYVDLLPDNWTAAPPPLPIEVVQELAKRARVAEKKQREQAALARQRQIPLSRVRVSHQPTFSRYVFELPELMPITTERDDDKFALTFDGTVKFDLSAAKAPLPPMVSSIDSEPGTDTTTVSIGLIGKVDVRSFREDNNYVVDVMVIDGKPKTGQLIPPPPPTPPPAPVAGLEPPQTVPAPQSMQAAIPAMPAEPPAPPAAPAAAPAAVLAAAPAPPPAAPPSAPPVAAAAAAAAPAASVPMPVAEMAAAPQPETMAEPAPAAPPPAAALPPAQAKPAEAKSEPATPPAEQAAVAPPAAAQRPRSPDAPVAVELRRQGDNLKLTFPFAVATPAAVFRRADTLWLVFDTHAKIDLSALSNGTSRVIRSATVAPAQDGRVVRIALDRPQLAGFTQEGTAWTVTIGDMALDPTRPLGIIRNTGGGGRASAIIPFESPGTLYRLTDPAVGDTLFVVTALAPARGFLKSQDFVEFSALASTQGVVVQPLADDVTVELGPDKVVVGRPSGLTLSSAAPANKRLPGYSPLVFDAQLWGFDQQANFLDRQTKLIEAAAGASESKRAPARFDLARFYLARDMYTEAKGVLDVTLGEDRSTADDTTGLVLRAVANIMLGRSDEALRDLSGPRLGNQHDAQLWRAVAYTRQGKWAEAREAFSGLDAVIGGLPIELQRSVLKDAVRASIEAHDFANAADRLNELDQIGVPTNLKPAVAVLDGELAEALGRNSDALDDYRSASESTSRPAAAQARLRETVLRYQLGDLKRSDVIGDLESLTTTWRGDDTEIEALQLLARLYTEEARYRDAFHVMRTAMQSHPNSEMTRRIQEEAAASFDSLFLAGKGDGMPAIEALALFYDFKELTPVGRRGDEMIRRLSDRLVSVDLLDQATELLQHQVDHRLQGAARAQVATRLAVIYLMNRKPDRAIATLNATRIANLPGELRDQRLLVEARALSDVGRHEVALEVVANIDGRESTRLRSDILWSAKRWGESAEQIELLYGERWRDWQPLNASERSDILRAAMGYALADDQLGLDRFAGKFAAKMAEGPDRHAFEVVTAPQTANAGEFREVARTVAAVDTLESFLRDMRARYPETGSFTPVEAAYGPGPPPGPQARAPAPAVPRRVTGSVPAPFRSASR